MAVLDPVKPHILSARLIPNVHPDFAAQLGLRPDQRSLALITCDIDDALYVSLDEATKMAEVEVVYAQSFYAGSNYPSGPLSGEIIGILAGPNPAEARAGLNACIAYAEEQAWFYSANEEGTQVFFPHTISRSGSYLSKAADVPEGTPLAYLIAPPIEATFAIDAALKAAEVTMRLWWKPPSETNFSGALLSGTQSACRAACMAFQDAVLDVARDPHKF
ncbi:MAG TPA: ethanolamine utilization microcompartment protein EutL [Anaerolineae bacterium]|nr:ethanolamine utilization microcompartment protein EutL [Anaerolineae bacterium]HOV47308.1 ethanolamine utilization microcompartment protein EutL [Anaerolineae bacterium]HPD39955.1 ethanolamine utilization microcompartment protein EutL [Anaerolineae bacterium]HQE98954.1 ethanolamine utilization microcompartment protein EutL [Anaerolineae bacterium]HRT30951.1 ethanolamine utilization microcompartment protein EutL [Anaerolineae bacterium]